MRGDGRIYLRGQTWWAQFYVRGEKVRESTGTTDTKEAQKFLRKRLREVAADSFGGPKFISVADRKVLIRELLEALQADYELRGIVSSQNRSSISRTIRDFGDFPALALKAEHVDAYIRDRQIQGHKSATINRVLQHLVTAYRLAIRRGHLTTMPVIRRLSERGNARKGFFSEQEIRAVIANLPEDLKDFVLFGYLVGWRKNEAATLSWADIEGDTICLRGENAKNGDARSVPIEGELADLLERRQQARLVDGVLMPTVFHRYGRPIGEFRKSWRSACKQAGVVGKIFHDLRRTAVRDMVRAGAPETVAMSISGHKTRSIFDRYNITDSNDQREVLRRTAEYRKDQQHKVVPMVR